MKEKRKGLFEKPINKINKKSRVKKKSSSGIGSRKFTQTRNRKVKVPASTVVLLLRVP